MERYALFIYLYVFIIYLINITLTGIEINLPEGICKVTKAVGMRLHCAYAFVRYVPITSLEVI